MEEIKSDRRDRNQASILKFLPKCTDLNVTRKTQAKCDKTTKVTEPVLKGERKSYWSILTKITAFQKHQRRQGTIL